MEPEAAARLPTGQFLQLRCGTIHYVDRGDGPPIVLLHAFPLDHTMWEPQVEALCGQYRLIAPALRGFGGPSVLSEGWTLDDAREDLKELFAALGISRCILVGLSMGGYIALHFYKKYSENIEGLILAGTRARADTSAEKNARTQMIAAVKEGGIAVLAERMLPRLLRPNAAPDVIRRVRSIIERSDPRAAIQALMAMRAREDSSSVLDKMDLPVLVIVGEQDPLTTVEECRLLAGRIRGARLVTIPEAGHLSNIENPPAFNLALRDFLERIA